MFGFFFVIGIVLNAVQIVFLIRGKKLEDPFQMILFSLAFADLLSLGFVFVLAVVWISTGAFVSQLLFVLLTSIIVSQLNIIIITFHRFLAVTFPLRLKYIVTSRRCFVSLVVVWVFSGLVSVFDVTFKLGYGAFFMLLLIIGCGFILLLSYTFIVYRVVRSHRSAHSTRVAPSPQNSRVLLHSIVVTFVFIVCNYPYALRKLLCGNKSSDSIDISVESFLLFFNPFIDPLIYFLLHKFRKASIQLLCWTTDNNVIDYRSRNFGRDFDGAVQIKVVNIKVNQEEACIR